MHLLQRITFHSIIVNYLSECLLCEVTFDNNKGYIAVLHKSPSQTSSDFKYFLSNFEKMLPEINFFKSDFSLILHDFNVRSKSWWKSDINTNAGNKIDAVIPSYGLKQLIPQPTHLISQQTHLQANCSSCIVSSFLTNSIW